MLDRTKGICSQTVTSTAGQGRSIKPQQEQSNTFSDAKSLWLRCLLVAPAGAFAFNAGSGFLLCEFVQLLWKH